MPSIFVRVAKFAGETPVKIMSGTPSQLNLNVDAGAGEELRVIPVTTRSTSGLVRTSLEEDDRLNQ
jgi:hypothetical protein